MPPPDGSAQLSYPPPPPPLPPPPPPNILQKAMWFLTLLTVMCILSISPLPFTEIIAGAWPLFVDLEPRRVWDRGNNLVNVHNYSRVRRGGGPVNRWLTFTPWPRGKVYICIYLLITPHHSVILIPGIVFVKVMVRSVDIMLIEMSLCGNQYLTRHFPNT